jgi:rSAM/selenodomain-associated transferase 1
MQQLIIFARTPVLGRVKTRMCPPLSPEQTLGLYRAFLADQCRLMRSLAAPRRGLEICLDGPWDKDDEENTSQIDLQGLSITQQISGDLGARLHAAFVRSRSNGNRMTIILGSDAPTLPAGHILQALDRLAQGARAVVSPAEDGGFILIGLCEPLETLFTDIPWGGERVLETVTIRAKNAGIDLELIEPWYDVDDIEGLRKLRGELQQPSIARQAPQTSIFLGQLPLPLD